MQCRDGIGLKEVIRWILIFVCLMICLAVEWRVLERFTKQAYENRYEAALELFRQDPILYEKETVGHENYQKVFQEQLTAILDSLRCYPIEKTYSSQVNYEDSWSYERTFGGNRRHEGTDLMAETDEPGRIPIVSMSDGVVSNLGWLTLGGWRIGITSETGVYYYYAHLDSYAPNLKLGDSVCAGQFLGFMGDSGYGEEGTTGMFPVHLHVGIYIYDEAGREISVNPYPFLVKLQENTSVFSKPSVGKGIIMWYTREQMVFYT